MIEFVRKVQPGADLVQTLNHLLPRTWYTRGGKAAADQRFAGLRIMETVYDPEMRQMGRRVGGTRLYCRNPNSRTLQKFVLTFDYRQNAYQLKKDAS